MFAPPLAVGGSAGWACFEPACHRGPYVDLAICRTTCRPLKSPGTKAGLDATPDDLITPAQKAAALQGTLMGTLGDPAEEEEAAALEVRGLFSVGAQCGLSQPH